VGRGQVKSKYSNIPAVTVIRYDRNMIE